MLITAAKERAYTKPAPMEQRDEARLENRNFLLQKNFNNSPQITLMAQKINNRRQYQKF